VGFLSTDAKQYSRAERHCQALVEPVVQPAEHRVSSETRYEQRLRLGGGVCVALAF
jgi:hypothetical protein